MVVATDETTVLPGTAGYTTLANRFDVRDNALTVMRLLLACLVAISHAGAIAVGHQIGFGPSPKAGMAELGGFALDVFFALSGFLVTMSYLRSNSLPRYLRHRCLRIFPGSGCVSS